jgi:hypothetical protein
MTTAATAATETPPGEDTQGRHRHPASLAVGNGQISADQAPGTLPPGIPSGLAQGCDLPLTAAAPGERRPGLRAGREQELAHQQAARLGQQLSVPAGRQPRKLYVPGLPGDDLAVGTGCGHLKSGAPARGERVAKYNRPLEIAAAAPALRYGMP